MRKIPARLQSFARRSLLLFLTSTPLFAANDWTNSYHSDGRTSIKQQFFPVMPVNLKAASTEAIAWSYLKAEAQTYGLDSDLSQLKLTRQLESPLGFHLYFSQEFNGLIIEGAEIIINILKTDNRIYQVYNNLQPIHLAFSKNVQKINREVAFDIAWKLLRVQGKLFEKPIAKLITIPNGSSLQTVWRVELSTTKPYGAWKIYIDAESGKIISYSDQRISHKPIEKKLPFASNGSLTNRRQEFARFQKNAELRLSQASFSSAKGVARVFDPDPRTTLNNNSLKDNSSPDQFNSAYLDRELLDIKFDGSRYSLEGPWVKIIDWDPPATPPSTSATGKWQNLRGNNAFNDVMTYYHIDKNQRYMQSLGFTGSQGIQFGPMEIDSDGVNGDDNSYYQPGSNRLSFGHGCVDDNEDADVILHEYGHAITYSINPNWGGGDMGAMGEGFGDYWAASYSLSTSNGSRFFPNQVYSWDGHGDAASCWPGRILNATAARYNPERSYGAHSNIEGGFQSDELWSTPLFQSRLRLQTMGVPREEVDTIILQAQFGLGSIVTMREMAQAIVVTAGQLYNGPHAQVFKENFLLHNILTEPHPVLDLAIESVKDSGGDGRIDPGENTTLKLRLSNSGDLTATSLRMTLSTSTPGVTWLKDASSYADLSPGSHGLNINLLQLLLDKTVNCGTLIKVTALVSFGNNQTRSFPFELRVGQAQGVSVQSTPKTPIPDANTKGINDRIAVSSSAVVSKEFKVGIDLRHPYRGDLAVSLISPKGTKIQLHSRGGISEDNIIGTYPSTLVPKESLNKLIGEPLNGTWQLQAADLAPSDTGTLQMWSLSDIATFQCK